MRKRAAIFTIQQAESCMLSKWREYYCQHFRPEDLYILCHSNEIIEPTQPNLNRLDYCFGNAIQVYNSKSFDHYWLRNTVAAFQAFLLNSYEYVLFTEIDEFIVPDPDKYPSGLVEYIATFTRPDVICNGFDIIHLNEIEAPLRLSHHWLMQRQFWIPSQLYSKPLLANHSLEWSPGFHQANNTSGYFDSDLFLLHFKRIDFDVLYHKNVCAAKRDWNKFDLQHNLGYQNRITDLTAFTNWFYADRDKVCTIPERFRKVSGL